MCVHWWEYSNRNPKAEAENCPSARLHSHSWSRGAVKPAKHFLYCLHNFCIWTWTLMGKDESVTKTPEYNSSVRMNQKQLRHSFQTGCATEVVSVTEEWLGMAPALHCPLPSPWAWATEGTQTPGLVPLTQKVQDQPHRDTCQGWALGQINPREKNCLPSQLSFFWPLKFPSYHTTNTIFSCYWTCEGYTGIILSSSLCSSFQNGAKMPLMESTWA